VVVLIKLNRKKHRFNTAIIDYSAGAALRPNRPELCAVEITISKCDEFAVVNLKCLYGLRVLGNNFLLLLPLHLALDHK
jgi:hypothetical protein